jgi:DTW domain-containing protein YfiP
VLPSVETRTRVLLVVHQLEARKPTNTGLLAARCLPNSAVLYRGRAPQGDVDNDARQPGAGLLGAAGELALEGVERLLLYPHPTAAPLEDWRDSPRPILLVVPDGTWRQAARTRARLESAGAAMTSVALPARAAAAAASAPRLRAPARPERLATMEALALALGILEGPEVEAALLRTYRMMSERTLWTNGRLPTHAVTGGIPSGVRPHDPLQLRPRLP